MGVRDPRCATAENGEDHLFEQFWIYLKSILTFDWGRAGHNEAVSSLFATRLPATLTVMVPT
jgi:peptide/nickel transport system permease protein